MIKLPAYLQPAVGFAMWHLLGTVQGSPAKKTPEHVVELLAAHPEYAGKSDETYRKVVCQALRNLAASEIAKLNGYNVTAAECFHGCDESC